MISEFEKKKIKKIVRSENVINICLVIGCFVTDIFVCDCLRNDCSKPLTIKDPWILYCLILYCFMILICTIFGISRLLDIHKQKKCLIKMFERLNKIKSNIWKGNLYEIKYIDNPEKFESDLFDELLSVKEPIYGKYNTDKGKDFESIYSYKELIEEKIKDTYFEMNKFYALRNPSMYIEEEVVEERADLLSSLLFKSSIKDEFIELYEYEKDSIDKTSKRIKLLEKAEKHGVILEVFYLNEMNKTMSYKDQVKFVKELGKLIKKCEMPRLFIGLVFEELKELSKDEE